MKFISAKVVLLFLIVCVSMVTAPSLLAQSAIKAMSNREAAATDSGWPRRFVNGPNSFFIYQPQIERWRGNQLEARAAVAITNGQSKQTTYGVMWFTTRAEIDKVNRLVTMTDFRITRVSFPTAPDRASLYQDLIEQRVPRTGEAIALDRIVADLAVAESKDENTVYQLKNEPPQIFFSTRPAILILIDGKPALRPVKGARFQRVVNTRVLILHDESNGKFYLHLMDGWMESSSVAGPWSIARETPNDLEQAMRAAPDSKQVDLLDGSGANSGNRKLSLKEAAGADAVPSVYTSTEPAELLQTQGDPQVESIEGTLLIYVSNTENDIFIDTATQAHYVLISGRWFRSQSMNGPWEYVPGSRLPAAFAKIPATHSKADVLVSIPGTAQAEEALIANRIPQTTAVARSAASLIINYDGQPRFEPIENTSLHYAVNSSAPVIAVGANNFYAVENGVWFLAASAAGPWAVATSVPSAIYTIPANSPLHYVTYVKVYGSTPEVVYVGYTPGYCGTVVSSDNVVVYGTGWSFPAYLGSYWSGWGWTYGYGAGFAWNAYAGWGMAFGIGYGWSSYYQPGAWYAAGWGGGNVAYSGTKAAWASPYTGNVGHGAAYAGVNTATGTRYNGRGFTNTNVYTGTTVSGVGRSAYNPNTGRIAAGQAGAVSNAYTGNGEVGARGAGYNPQTGVISGGAAGATYNAATGQSTAAGRGFAYNTKTDTGVAVGNNNVYAGKDGNVYRYNKSDGLQQHTTSGWSSAGAAADAQSIQSQRAARASGQQRWDNFRSAGSFSPGSGSRGFGNGGFAGGSGPRLGGGRRR